MLKRKRRSSDQIERIRDHLKKMISCPLQTIELNSNQLYSTNTTNITKDTHSLPINRFVSKYKQKKNSARISKFQITLSLNKKNDFHPQCDNKVQKSGRLRKYDRFTLFKYLHQRKQDNLSHVKPELSFGQLICLAILQSDERKLILFDICHWISANFPFYKLTDTNWQNSVRHTLSINPNFIKLESVKISNSNGVKDNKNRKRYVFVGKDNNGLNKVNQNVRKSSKWGVTSDDISSFFICSPNDLHLFIDMVKQINHPIFETVELKDSYSTDSDSLIVQDPQRAGPFSLDLSSPLSQVSNNSKPLSNSSSMTDLTTLSVDNTSTLGLPFFLVSSVDSTLVQKLEGRELPHQQEIIYDIDSKLDLLKTPKFDTASTRCYVLNAFENSLHNNNSYTNISNANNNINIDNFDMNRTNNDFVPSFFTDLNPPSPTLIFNESTLYPNEPTSFSIL